MRCMLVVLGFLTAPALEANVFGLCNQGNTKVYFAYARQDTGWFSGSSWDVKGWFGIAPGDCGSPYDTGLGGGPVHVVITFTDSRGVWGLVPGERISLSTMASRSEQEICVKKDVFHYDRVPNGRLGTSCERSGALKVRASVYSSAMEGSDFFGNCLGCARADIRLTANDRAIPVGPQESPGSVPSRDPDMTKWVRQDVRAYIAAAATGFESYKGEPRMVDGERKWDSKVKPLLADSCDVEGPSSWVSLVPSGSVGFICQLYTSMNQREIKARYDNLLADISEALPDDWKPYPDGLKPATATCHVPRHLPKPGFVQIHMAVATNRSLQCMTQLGGRRHRHVRRHVTQAPK